MESQERDSASISFSAVIPTYNAGKFIDHAIESALSQTFPVKQVLVVDDGSTDETKNIVTGFKDPRVQYLYKAHSGISATRNHAIPHTTGSYTAYLDADDWWDPLRLEQMKEAAEQTGEPAFIFTDFHRCNLETSEVLLKNSEINPQILDIYTEKVDTGTNPLYIYSPKEALKLIAVSGYPMYPSAFAVRTDVLKNINGWDSRWERCEDLDFCLRIAKSHSLVYIHEDLTTVGRHSDHGDLQAYILKQNKWDVAILKHHWQTSSDTPEIREILKSGYIKRLSGLAWRYRHSGQHKEADGYYKDLAAMPGLKLKGCRYRFINQLSRLMKHLTQNP